MGAEGTSHCQRTVTLTDVNGSVRVEHAHLRLEPELVTRLQASVGLRNVLTHEYVEIDLEIVASAVPSAGQDYRQYVQQMASWIARRPA